MNKEVQPINNGNVLETYSWTQNHKDVTITIPLPPNVKARDIVVDFYPNKLFVKLRNSSEPIIEGELFSIVKSENCFWMLDGSDLVIELDKKKFDEWWKYVVEGEPEIDLSKIVTPNGSLEDLDQETRMTIDKMLYEQKIKEENGHYKNV